MYLVNKTYPVCLSPICELAKIIVLPNKTLESTDKTDRIHQGQNRKKKTCEENDGIRDIYVYRLGKVSWNE